jgi:choline dehydrogenase
MRISTAIAYYSPHAAGRTSRSAGAAWSTACCWKAPEDETAGTKEQVHGGRITLAGGTIGTPAILLRSGIGPADDLRQMGIAPVVDLPGSVQT